MNETNTPKEHTTKPKRERRHYDAQFKKAAVEHGARHDGDLSRTANELGINSWTLRDWVEAARTAGRPSFARRVKSGVPFGQTISARSFVRFGMRERTAPVEMKSVKPQTQDKQLSGIALAAVLEKRRLDQSLNAKEFAVCAGVSYSTARAEVPRPGSDMAGAGGLPARAARILLEA